MTDKPTFIRDAGLARPAPKPKTKTIRRFKLEDVERENDARLRELTEVVVPDGMGWINRPGQIILTHPKRPPVNFHWDFWGPLVLGVSIGFLLGLLALGRG